MKKEPVIGVIGGMGPYAGIDLVEKIFDQTQAVTDQDHLPVALLSLPHRIGDRSAYLRGECSENPADAIAKLARQLDTLGATVAGIPCNTAHAPVIYNSIRAQLRASGASIRLLHMIKEAVRFAREERRGLRGIGVISTLAVYRLGLYTATIEAAGFDAVLPDEDIEINLVERTIFDPAFGIKAFAHPVTSKARQNVLDAITHLREKGADAVILGCTELPLAIPETEIDGTLIIDPTLVLARALIRETYPDKLVCVNPEVENVSLF
ncbi:MAG: aspartate/glutamate racemase family protein [Rhodothermales bacterium]